MIDVGMVTLTFITIFGLFVGSFLNVVIYRLPRECLSVVKDTRSRCPRCGLQLTWYDNIPVFSYVILLRGKCRGCRVPISFRYPFVELLTGAAFASLAWIDLGASGLDYPTEAGRAWLLLGVHALVLASLIALSAIDIDFRILPDAITLSGIVAAPVIVFLVPEAMPAPLWMPFADAPGTWGMNLNALANGLAGAAFAAGVLYGIGWLGSKAFRKPAMGLGDVKLFAAMGGFLGIWFLFSLMVASLAGSVIGIMILMIRRDRYVPFGPFLGFGMVLSMLWGPTLWDQILHRMGTC